MRKAAGLASADDTDALSNQEVLLPGDLMLRLSRSLLDSWLRSLVRSLRLQLSTAP